MNKIKELALKFKKIITDNLDSIIKPTATLVVIAFAVTLALSLTNMLTAPKIADLAAADEKKAMSKLIEAESYTEKKLPIPGEVKLEHVIYNVAEDKDGNTLGYIFKMSEKGYGGEVQVMVAINADCTVKAIDVLDASNETPGLGQNVKKEKFFTQFDGKNAKISLVKNGADSENNEINAVTGATISSKAVTRAVNQAIDYANIIIGTSSQMPEVTVTEGGAAE